MFGVKYFRHAMALLLLASSTLGGCASFEIRASIPTDSAPDLTGLSLDKAAIACLDWAWSVSHRRELAGGIVLNSDFVLECTPLTMGSPDSVEYLPGSGWIAHFHTHTRPGRISSLDKETVQGDPQMRRSYMREPSGIVWVYECLPHEESYECGERFIPTH